MASVAPPCSFTGFQMNNERNTPRRLETRAFVKARPFTKPTPPRPSANAARATEQAGAMPVSVLSIAEIRRIVMEVLG